MIKKYFQKLYGSKFVKNVIIVALGSSGVQIVGAIFSPLIARQYGPEAFGLLGSYGAALSLIAPLSTLAYPTAIILPKTDFEAQAIAKLSGLIATTVSIVFFLFISLSNYYCIPLSIFSDLGLASYLLPVGVFFYASIQILNQWLIRKELFGLRSKSAIVQSLGMNLGKLGFGFICPSGITLIIMLIVCNFFYSIQLFLHCRKDFQNQDVFPDFSLFLTAKKYKDFAFFKAPQIFFNSLSLSIPILLLSSFFGTKSAGFYNMSKVILGVPVSLIGYSTADVLFPKLADEKNKGRPLFKTVLEAIKALFFVSFFPFLIIVLAGPQIFSIVLGESWETAGEYARWMAFWSFFSLLARPCSSVIPILNLQKAFLIFEIFALVAKMIFLYAGFFYFASDKAAIVLFSFISIINHSVFILATLFFLHSFEKIKGKGDSC